MLLQKEIWIVIFVFKISLHAARVFLISFKIFNQRRPTHSILYQITNYLCPNFILHSSASKMIRKNQMLQILIHGLWYSDDR